MILQIWLAQSHQNDYEVFDLFKVSKFITNIRKNIITKNKKILLKHIMMVNPTTYELRLIARSRGIKNYQNVSREKLLSTLDETEGIFENPSKASIPWYWWSRIQRNKANRKFIWWH